MKRIAVLRGGPSEEYEVSMSTGKNVLEALKSLDYVVKDIVISKSGEWLDSGISRSPETALDAVDVVFIALHGKYGEDGQVQKILQRKHIPFTGSRSLPSAIAFNKDLTKKALEQHNILTPKHKVLRGESLWSVSSEINSLYKELGTDLFLKPVSSGSSFGTFLVKTQDDLELALEKLLNMYGEVLVEEFILGKEATVGVLQNFRGEYLYALPPIEIVPAQKGGYFTNDEKYNGQAVEICPGRFSYEEKQDLINLALLVHTALGCDHYSRSDFLISNGKVYFLEINTLPGLTSESLLPKAAQSVGLEFKDLVRHLIETATV